jgi:hypothetical protein
MQFYTVHQGGFNAQFCPLGYALFRAASDERHNRISCELREHSRVCDLCKLPDPGQKSTWWEEDEDCGSDPEETIDEWED